MGLSPFQQDRRRQSIEKPTKANVDEVRYATFAFVGCVFGVKSKLGCALGPSGCRVCPLNHSTPEAAELFSSLSRLRPIPFLPSAEDAIILKPVCVLPFLISF